MSNTSARTPVRVGVFENLDNADRAVHLLHEQGFTKHEINVICPTCAPGRPGDRPNEYEKSEPAGANTKVAATSGGAIGAVLGGLLAIASAAATGGAALLVAGPLFAGAAGGAVAGGLIGAMMTRGVEKEIANFYDQAVKNGKVLVGVECHGEDQAERLALAEKILYEAGSEPIALREG